ncbi:cyclin-dependent kinase 2-interacting protein [Orussus abietinus]|uniref:cyclin-dependent kinase 2-interacting protein n=1 Tax=Orussus abietinus TaxID=222816 RepID=UPI00062508CB|nr:cyclin-dependent kinase 2-interacting protein [Orussus abietinus]
MQISPAKGEQSPLAKLFRGKNLTGNPRIVRDLVASLHNNIQEWNIIHLHGLDILKNITSIKKDGEYSNQLDILCNDLEDDCIKLHEIVKNLEHLSYQLRTAVLLKKEPKNLFLTWPIEKYGHVAEIIYNAYKNEVAVKYSILENVAHDHRESAKMLHLAMWVRQVEIPENINLLLESMLLETGFR